MGELIGLLEVLVTLDDAVGNDDRRGVANVATVVDPPADFEGSVVATTVAAADRALSGAAKAGKELLGDLNGALDDGRESEVRRGEVGSGPEQEGSASDPSSPPSGPEPTP